MFSLRTNNKIEADCVGHTFMWTKCASKTIKNIKRMLIHNRASGSRLDQKTLHLRSFSTNETLVEVIHTNTFIRLVGIPQIMWTQLIYSLTLVAVNYQFKKGVGKTCHYLWNAKKHRIWLLLDVYFQLWVSITLFLRKNNVRKNLWSSTKKYLVAQTVQLILQ